MSTEPPPVDTSLPAPGPDPTDPAAPPPLPPAPDLPAEPITFTPGLWYTGQVTCLTLNRQGTGEPCRNAHQVWQIPRVWSNDGHVWAQCGLCCEWVTFLSATVLDPQPTEA